MAAKLEKEQLEGLLEYATPTQASHIKAWIECGTAAKAAKAQGVSERNILLAKKNAISTAAKAGWSADKLVSRQQEHGFHLKGKSLFVNNETGEATRAWYKYDANKDDQLNSVLDSIEARLSCIKPRKRIKKPKSINGELMTVLPYGDPHLGMYAYHEEAGKDFDCDIAEEQLLSATAYLISKLPPAKECVLLNLGDFFHRDNDSNRTRSGNELDGDTRWSRVFEIGVELMSQCVEMALEKNDKVIVKNVIGNHDSYTSRALSIAMKREWKNNDRVTIAEPSNPFFFHKFGKVMIASTHGDKLKPEKMPEAAANYQAQMWGETLYRYGMFGHFHHKFRKEIGGMIVEIFNTLASQDAWHHASGYKSSQFMEGIVFHSELGEVERYTYDVRQLL